MNLTLFYSFIFSKHFAYGVMVPSLVIWQASQGLSFLEIGTIQSVGFLVVLLSEVPSSYLADRLGKRLVLMAGLVVSVACFALLSIASTMLGFLLAQVCFSLGSSFFSGTQESLLHDLLGDDQRMTKALGKMSIVDEVGTMLGMLSSSLLIMLWTVPGTYVLGLIMMLGASLSFLFTSPVPSLKDDTAFEWSWGQLSKLSFLTWPMIFFFSLMAYRGEILYQASFEELGLKLSLLGGLYTFAKLFSILGSATAYRLEEEFGERAALQGTALLQVLAFSSILLQNWIFTVCGLCLFFFSENAFRNIRDAWVLDHAPKKYRTTLLSGLSFTAAGLALFVKPIVGIGLDESLMWGVLIVVFVKVLAALNLFYNYCKKT